MTRDYECNTCVGKHGKPEFARHRSVSFIDIQNKQTSNELGITYHESVHRPLHVVIVLGHDCCHGHFGDDGHKCSEVVNG